MFTKRLDNLREQLKASDIDCLALLPGANLRYLTGLNFHLMERAFIACFPADAEPVLLLPSLEVSKWEAEAPFPAQIFGWNDTDGPAEAMRQTAAALPEVHQLAVEHLRMRVQEYKMLQRQFPSAVFAVAEEVMDALRRRKDAAEVASMRRACQIAEIALEQVVSGLSPGVTEREVANRLLIALLEAGGEEVPFEPIVLGGPKSAQPHGTPGERPIEAGDILLVDFGTTVDGYASDITRTFVMSQEPDEQVRAMYEAVQAANAAGLAACKPGATPQDVDRAARQAIAERGLGELFFHRTGHGLGLEAHESPSIMEGVEQPLEVGMAFTVEPGVYDSEIGGIRIEDNVVITEDGAESLTSFDRDLRVVGA